jgi:Glu-tRNA(Gln) amidotransferase subunit E-like FAD-binding protein
MKREDLDPGVYSGILDYVIRADKDPSAANEKLCNKNMQASYTACRISLLENFKSFTTLVRKELTALEGSNTCGAQCTKIVLTGGGAMDEGRKGIVSDQYRGTTVENRGSSNIS